MDRSTQRVHLIDFMKGICILSVVVRHIYPQLFPGKLGLIIYSVQVPVFFYLSGVLDPTKSESVINTTLKNVNRIFIPYIYWFFFGILIFLPFEYFAFYAYKSVNLFSYYNLVSFLYTPNKNLITNYPCWFLLALFEIKIIHLVFEKLFFKVKKKSNFIYSIVTILVIIVYNLCLNNIVIPFSISSAIINIPFFYIGKLTKKHIINSEFGQKYRSVFLVFTIVSMLLIYKFLKKYDSNNCILPSNIISTYFLLVSGIFVIYTISLFVNKFHIINFAGENSMIILVSHVLIYNILPNSLPRYVLLIITLCLSYFMIPICNKYIPFFVGKKDIVMYIK